MTEAKYNPDPFLNALLDAARLMKEGDQSNIESVVIRKSYDDEGLQVQVDTATNDGRPPCVIGPDGKNIRNYPIY